MVGGVGEIGEGGRKRRQKEEESDFVLEEDMKRGGHRLDKCGEANRRQGGLDHVKRWDRQRGHRPKMMEKFSQPADKNGHVLLTYLEDSGCS